MRASCAAISAAAFYRRATVHDNDVIEILFLFFSSLLSLERARARIWAGREIPLPSLVKRNTRPVQKEERKKKNAAHFVANGKSRGEDAPFNGDRSKNGFDFR